MNRKRPHDDLIRATIELLKLAHLPSISLTMLHGIVNVEEQRDGYSVDIQTPRGKSNWDTHFVCEDVTIDEVRCWLAIAMDLADTLVLSCEKAQ